MNDNDRRDLARVLLRAASQALEADDQGGFLGLRRGTGLEMNRIWLGIDDVKAAARVSNWMRTIEAESVPTDFAALCADYAGKLLQLMGERR